MLVIFYISVIWEQLKASILDPIIYASFALWLIFSLIYKIFIVIWLSFLSEK